ncbi:hypothetical protein PIB30_046847 [Stylosanthes scabra]|uniref:Uncharacterized protein n=1 Tax=Stylosanthes scabra TaxID=79078 RepID=A0ABU6XGT8_9FABA|nr:hypothetical protein [Stylosanthes scabra]
MCANDVGHINSNPQTHTSQSKETSARQNLPMVGKGRYGNKPMTTAKSHIRQDSAPQSESPGTSTDTGWPARRSPSSNERKSAKRGNHLKCTRESDASGNRNPPMIIMM